jgi:hypothetical protein
VKEATTFTPSLNSDNDYETVIDQLLAEMRVLTADMDERQHRIECLQTETRAILEQIEQMRAN